MAGLVLRFRSSHHIAAHSHANFGIIRSTSKLMILVRFYGFEVPTELAASSDRNFKSTALGLSSPRDSETDRRLARSCVNRARAPAWALLAAHGEICHKPRRAGDATWEKPVNDAIVPARPASYDK